MTPSPPLTSLSALCIITCALASLVAAQSDDTVLKTPESREAFGCQVCKTFCVEYEAKIKEKKGDDPFDAAVAFARGNTSLYRWDERHRVLRPPGQALGVRVFDQIYSQLDSHVLTTYNVQVVLHALHAAAHVQYPPKMNWHFCLRVLCDQHLNHCEPDPDKRPYGEMTKAFEHFRDHFDSRHGEPQRAHNRRPRRTATDAHSSVIRERYADPQSGHIDPAQMANEVAEQYRRDVEAADRGEL
jgi:hypothetical protein